MKNMRKQTRFKKNWKHWNKIKRGSLLTLFFVFIQFSLNAQEKTTGNFDFKYDHYSLIVKDLEKTGEFYKDILRLKEIPHPSATSGFRWFVINGNSQLHLIEKDSVAMKHSKSVHLCLATQKLDAFIAYLKEKEVAYSDWPGKPNSVTLRADGVRQIYVQDPENNWVEINTAVH